MTTSSNDRRSDASTDSEAPPQASNRPPNADLLLDHAYDGIKEYDNPLPRWWVWIFAGSFWFSLAYFLTYHVFDRGTSIHDAYAEEMRVVTAEREKQALKETVSEESLEKLADNPAAVAAGQELFQTRCTPCHGAQGQGIIGPNLTDNSWIHGSSLMDIYKVVNEGVLAKGMPAWGQQLKPEEVRRAVAFVNSLRGKNVPGKPPEGTPSP